MSGAASGRPATEPPSGGYEPRYSLTFGDYKQTEPWTDVRSLTWRELTCLLTGHEVGAKAGSCVVPAVFSGQRRQKGFAARIEVAFLDSDSGAPLHEIRSTIEQRGWAAVISSTHSHLTTQTVVKRSHWDRFRAQSKDQDHAAVEFLLRDKQYLSHVAAGAQFAAETMDHVTLTRQPCPKFRVAIPLSRPWVAAEYPDQDQANAAWADRVAALAAALRVEHDQACTDTSRLFYLPRRPPNGPTPETVVVEGAPCEIFGLPSASPIYS